MRVDRSCEACGRGFVARSWALARGWDRCCSRACADRWRYSPRRRFWRCVERTDDCWLWTGPTTPEGVPYFLLPEDSRRRRRGAALLVWEDAYGPVPPGRIVRPRCAQAACVRPDHLGIRRASTRPIGGRLDHRLASVCAHPRPLFWTRERVTAALERFHRQTGQAPTSSDAWRALTAQPARSGRRPFPSPVVLRYLGSFRAAWAGVGVELDKDGAPWTEREDAYLRATAGVLPRGAIARALGRSAHGVKARLRRLRRQRGALPSAAPPGRGSEQPHAESGRLAPGASRSATHDRGGVAGALLFAAMAGHLAADCLFGGDCHQF